MATKHAALLLLAALFFANDALGFSVSQDEFDKLIESRCFNRSTTTGLELVLGQNDPVGMSLENVISLIERMERLNPNLKQDQILKLLLRRFHIDGVKYNGLENLQSSLEFSHAQLTNAILGLNTNEPLEFPENQFTEDEKCNLFFSMSHVVNETALQDEEESQIYWSLPTKTAKAPATNERNLGSDVPVPPTKATTPKAVQSDFIENTPIEKEPPKKLQKRADPSYGQGSSHSYKRNIRLTKKPREYGAVSFLSSKSNPIAISRVLLGMYVGFAGIGNRKVSEILTSMQKNLKDMSMNNEIESLLAVTLGDLYGIDTGEGMTNSNDKIIFGADGAWKSTVCNTKFELISPGNWVTLAEFRGGIDGYNIGRFLQDHLKENPDIKASQLLRFYYTKNGVDRTNGVCSRGHNNNGDIKDTLRVQATGYLFMWNAVSYNNQYSKERILSYINQVEKQFTDTLDKAVILNEDEKSVCSETVNSNEIRARPVESIVDALFLLDITQKCSPDVECNQAAYVDVLTKILKLGRNAGSASVLFNARGVESPNLVDDEMRPVATPLFSSLFNSTSNECASCKASNYDSSAREVLSDRVELLQQLNFTLGYFEEKRSNESGVPAKAVFWFDYGTAKPIPTDKIQKVNYEQVKRTLLFVQRDFTFFGIGTNTSNLKDMVPQEGNLISVVPNENLRQSNVASLVPKVLEVPQVFQYADCRTRSSNNYTYQGFITPGFKQYWAMYPNYFRSSSAMQLKFSAESIPIQVCFGRTLKPEEKDQSCKKATKANDEISWMEYSPCKGSTFENCPPLYFTVSVDKSDSPLCKDERCQNIDQVKWYFSHTGISCSGSYAISISLLLMTITSILSLVFNRNNLL